MEATNSLPRATRERGQQQKGQIQSDGPLGGHRPGSSRHRRLAYWPVLGLIPTDYGHSSVDIA